MKFQDSTSVASGVVEGGVTATTVAFLHTTVLHMIPYLIPAIPLILLDLYVGIRAARHRYKRYHREQDRVRFSRALRGTVGKFFEFVCWIIVATSLSIVFDRQWIEWVTLGAVYLNEIVSVVENYLCTKSIEFSLLDFLRILLQMIIRWIGARLGFIADDIDTGGVFKPTKQPRGKDGRYLPKLKDDEIETRKKVEKRHLYNRNPKR